MRKVAVDCEELYAVELYIFSGVWTVEYVPWFCCPA